MKTLVLDLATHLGFCFGTDADGAIEHGSFKLPSTGPDIGKFLHAYRDWLTRAIGAYAPDEIVFEMPILPGTTNLHTCRKLYSLCGLTELIADDHKIECREANLTHIRCHFIGVMRAPKEIAKDKRRAWLKERTVSECRARGFRPADDNEADALALFSFVVSERLPTFYLRASARRDAA